jgi:hypothetical protein
MKARRGLSLLLLLLLVSGPVAMADRFGWQWQGREPEPDPTAIARLLGLRGEAFAEAFSEFTRNFSLLQELGRDRPYPAPDLVRLLEHARQQAGQMGSKEDEARDFESLIDELLQETIPQADDALLDRLAVLVAQVPDKGVFWARSFSAIVARLLRRELTALKSEGPVVVRLEPPAAAERTDTPPVSPDLRDAWRRFTAAVGPELQRDAHAKPGIGFSTNIGGYVALLDQLLRGSGAGLAEKLDAYFSDGGCIADPLFYQTIGPARWLALVRERRLPEAIAVALMARNLSLADEDDPVRGEFLALCGLDPAQLDAGWWLARLEPWSLGRGFSYSNGRAAPEWALERLAEGTEQHARWVVELARLARGDEDPGVLMNQRKSFIDALAMIVQRQPRDPALLGPFRSTAALLPDDVRRAAAAELAALIDARLEPVHVKQVMEKVTALGVRDAIAPLRRRLEQPPAEMRLAAAAALRALGEAVADPAIREPVRIRLISGGKPIAGQLLSAEFPGAPKPVRTAAGGFMGSFQSDENGLVAVPWEDYQSVAQVASRMVLQSDGWQMPHPIPPGEKGARFFTIAIPLVADPPRETAIVIPTQRVALRLEFARPLAWLAKQTIDIRLTQRQAGAEISRGVLGDWKIPPVSELTAWVQPGTYQVCVVAPGHRIWKREPIEIGDRPVTLPVELQRGTDVTFQFVDATGAPYPAPAEFTPSAADPAAGISRRFAYEGSLPGLPAGRYSLAVPSSEEWHAVVNRGRPLHESAPRYAGKVVEFEIPAALPPTLELGRIVVPRKEK